MKKHGGKDIWNPRMEWGSDVWEYIPINVWFNFPKKIGLWTINVVTCGKPQEIGHVIYHYLDVSKNGV